MFDDMPEDKDDDITEELCPECGESIDDCECDDETLIDVDDDEEDEEDEDDDE